VIDAGGEGQHQAQAVLGIVYDGVTRRPGGGGTVDGLQRMASGSFHRAGHQKLPDRVRHGRAVIPSRVMRARGAEGRLTEDGGMGG